MRKVSCLALLVAASLGMAASANASWMTYTSSFTAYPNYSNTFTFNKFDSALGHLDSVTVELSLDVTGGSYQVENLSTSPASGTMTFGTTGSLAGPAYFADNSDNLLTSPVSAVTNKNVSLAATDGTQDFSGGDSNSLAGATQWLTNTAIVGTSYTYRFASATNETFKITAKADYYMNFSVAGGIAGAYLPQTARSAVTVTYNYSQIPEPVAFGLVGIGGLVLMRRHRQKA